jgi:CRP/FNR family transcriptional regulator, cyclic AMP receptor protein
MRRFSIQGLREILLPRPNDPAAPDRTSAAERAAFGPLPLMTSGRKHRDLAAFLGEVTLFADFSHWELGRLARNAHERTYRDGEYVYQQGMPGMALFLVRSGIVEITRRDPKGEEVPILRFERPASFSEQAAIGADTARWTSAVARGPVSLVALGKSDLDSLGRRFPLLANRVLSKLAQIVVQRLEVLIDTQLQPSEAQISNGDAGK